MIRQPISFRQKLLLALASVLFMIFCYSQMSIRQHRHQPDDTTIPTWSQLKDGVAKCFEADKRGDRWIVVDSLATGKRLFLGLASGISGAIILGLLMGCFSRAEAFFLPPLSILAKIPPTAALAVFFVLVGTDLNMYVAMIGFGILPTLAQTIYLGIKDVRDEFIYKALTLGASPTEVIWNVIVRQVLPRLIDAIRLQIGPAMVFLIAAEMVVGHEGFGYRIRLQSKLLDMKVVYPYLVFLASFGYTMDYGMRLLQKIACPWYAKEGRS